MKPKYLTFITFSLISKKSASREDMMNRVNSFPHVRFQMESINDLQSAIILPQGQTEQCWNKAV